MCGIAGFFHSHQPASEATLAAMLAAIVHRGPDDEGRFTSGGIALGMRRLSIIDLHTGHQPISNEDGSIWVVFNGEIYNYQELRRDLIAKGHRFRTNSDTETLIHLYEEEGPSGVERLRGMFAYAIWDEPRQSLFIARDRFGKKPLFYAQHPRGLVFASELKCLRVHDLDWSLDQEALSMYFLQMYIPEPYTPFGAVKKLPAGSWLRYHAASGKLEQHTYWRPPAPSEDRGPTVAASQGDWAQKVREAFDEAVRIRMIADVPLGAFLSGGIDSGLVVASMARQSEAPVKTFSIGFEEASFNELPAARLVAQRYRTDHHELILRPDSGRMVERLVRQFDEPFGDSSAIPTLMVSEFARKHVKVALSGDGGDELFGGYQSFQDIERFRRWDSVPQAARSLLAGLARLLPYSAYGKNFLWTISRPSALERYLTHNTAPYFFRERLLQPAWRPPSTAAGLRALLPHCFLPAGDVLSQALYFETTAKLTGDMLVKVDRASMAASLEVRCPLLDHPLAELAAAIPPGLKVRPGRGKAILLDALGDRLPPELLTLPKKGFGVPLAEWFRGDLRSMLWDTLGNRAFLDRGIVHPDFLKTILVEHDSGRRNHYHWLWSLLMLELWFQDWRQPTYAAHRTELPASRVTRNHSSR